MPVIVAAVMARKENGQIGWWRSYRALSTEQALQMIHIDTCTIVDVDINKHDEDDSCTVVIYLNSNSIADFYGDDWNDSPFVDNAGVVYDEYIDAMIRLPLKYTPQLHAEFRNEHSSKDDLIAAGDSILQLYNHETHETTYLRLAVNGKQPILQMIAMYDAAEKAAKV